MYNLVAIKGDSRMVISGHTDYDSAVGYMEKIASNKHNDETRSKEQ